VTCSVSTNNVLNSFTPYGDGSLIRMANLYANVCHVSRPADLAGCLDMITGSAAKLMRLNDYGIRIGAPADLVCIDAKKPGGCDLDPGGAALGPQARPTLFYTVARRAACAGEIEASLKHFSARSIE
jgi:cytosine/adenosine deaminase-related metal-dependent hydrolase